MLLADGGCCPACSFHTCLQGEPTAGTRAAPATASVCSCSCMHHHVWGLEQCWSAQQGSASCCGPPQHRTCAALSPRTGPKCSTGRQWPHAPGLQGRSRCQTWPRAGPACRLASLAPMHPQRALGRRVLLPWGRCSSRLLRSSRCPSQAGSQLRAMGDCSLAAWACQQAIRPKASCGGGLRVQGRTTGAVRRQGLAPAGAQCPPAGLTQGRGLHSAWALQACPLQLVPLRSRATSRLHRRQCQGPMRRRAGP